MISAFGIEHTISKSYLGGGKWGSASSLSYKKLGQVARGGHYKASRGVKEGDRAWLENRKKNEIPALKAHVAEHGSGVQTDPTGIAAGTYRTGGKSSGASYVVGGVPKGLKKPVIGHEGQHANVKRSSYRLHRQIMSNPKKMMREEARADYRSVGHYDNRKQFSAYSGAARALNTMKTKGAKTPYEWTKADRKAFKGMGYKKKDRPKISNKQAYQAQTAQIQAALPHYDVGGKKGQKAIGAYAKLQNKMKAKGVPEGQIKVPKKYRNT